MIRFAKRNLMVFFRDKSAVFFSLLSALIIVALYALFLGDTMTQGYEAVPEVRALMDSWIVAGILAITSITTTMGAYGTMVDEFQHIVYANPDMSCDERNEVWARLEKEYRPWIDFDGLPFYGRGAGWQRQLHIYEVPFYYLDYCLAQTVALQFFTAFLKDKEDAWNRYLALVEKAGTESYPGLVAAAGFESPFREGTLRRLGGEVADWIEQQDRALQKNV